MQEEGWFCGRIAEKGAGLWLECAALGKGKIKGFVLWQDKGLPKCLRLTYQYSLLQQQSLHRRPRVSVTTTPAASKKPDKRPNLTPRSKASAQGIRGSG